MTNEVIGVKIGLSHSAVSRLRRGQRLPSVPTMVAIERVFGWSVADQVKARTGKGAAAYSTRFNEEVTAHFDTPGV
jgi:transcriptional regulator with XRE-family HTH domain